MRTDRASDQRNSCSPRRMALRLALTSKLRVKPSIAKSDGRTHCVHSTCKFPELLPTPSVHACPSFKGVTHGMYGIPAGPQGYGQPRLCGSCQESRAHKPSSASPTRLAFCIVCFPSVHTCCSSRTKMKLPVRGKWV